MSQVTKKEGLPTRPCRVGGGLVRASLSGAPFLPLQGTQKRAAASQEMGQEKASCWEQSQSVAKLLGGLGACGR